MHVLKTVNLKKTYATNTTPVEALKGVNIVVNHGEFVCIIGTSGSGKSTLLNLMGGLDTPTEGEVFLDSVAIYNLSEEERTILRRRKIGFVFQNYNLIPTLNVYDNIILPIGLDSQSIDVPYIEKVADALGISDKLNALPNQLSGGQQQRVALARALSSKPSIVVADEPTGNLDSGTSQEVVNLIKLTATQFGQTVVMVTHNEAIAQLADRTIRIEDGLVAGGDNHA